MIYNFTVKGRTVIDEGFRAVEHKFRDFYKVKEEETEAN